MEDKTSISIIGSAIGCGCAFTLYMICIIILFTIALIKYIFY